VVVVFRRSDGTTQALLIENKIDAKWQAEQAARYRVRGDKGIEAEDWQAYRTVLVAPDQFVAGSVEAASGMVIRGHGRVLDKPASSRP
jgi:hypothetical protein